MESTASTSAVRRVKRGCLLSPLFVGAYYGLSLGTGGNSTDLGNCTMHSERLGPEGLSTYTLLRRSL